MVMSAIEWIVLVFACVSLIKICFFAVNRKGWLPVVRTVYKNKAIFSILFVALAGLIFYYLIMELTIVQIIATSAFASLLVAVGIMQYSDEILKSIQKAFERKMSGWLWIYVLIWVALLGWAVYEIFI